MIPADLQHPPRCLDPDRLPFRLIGLPEGAPSMLKKTSDLITDDGMYDIVDPWIEVGMGVIYQNQGVAMEDGGIVEFPLRQTFCGLVKLSRVTDFALCSQPSWPTSTDLVVVVYENISIIHAPMDLYIPDGKTAALRIKYEAARYL